MMFIKTGIRTLIIFLLFIHSASAEYEIKGQVTISPDWHYQIFLSTINKLDDDYNGNPQDIIQVGNIEQDVSFSLKGDSLPLESRFYLLQILKYYSPKNKNHEEY